MENMMIYEKNYELLKATFIIKVSSYCFKNYTDKILDFINLSNGKENKL